MAKFADGCHKWGWLIAIISTALMNLVIYAYFQGTISQSLADTKERVIRLEQQWDQYIREVRSK